MFFIVMKLLKLGINQHKKRKARQNPEQTGWYDNGANEMQLRSQLTGGGVRSAGKVLADSFLRFFQFVMALTVVGLYGVDIHHAHQKHAYADPKWVYAEATAALGSLTALFYLLTPFILKARPLALRTGTHLPLFVWEAILCILWLTLFGIFGKMYISEDAEGDSGIVRMKHAVWVDVVNLVLWVITATWCGLRWWKGQSTARGFEEEKNMEAAEI